MNFVLLGANWKNPCECIVLDRWLSGWLSGGRMDGWWVDGLWIMHTYTYL